MLQAESNLGARQTVCLDEFRTVQTHQTNVPITQPEAQFSQQDASFSQQNALFSQQPNKPIP